MMSEAQKTKDMTDEQKINEWELLFPSPEVAKQYRIRANQLIKAGLGKRKKESDLEYMMRIQYCIECGIKLCFVNDTYIVSGKVARMVELKGILFAEQFPNAEINVIVSTPELCKIKGRASPDHNWIPVTWDVKKAKNLKAYKDNVHWKFNTQRMLNKSAKGDFYDLAGGVPMSENTIRDDVEEKDDEH